MNIFTIIALSISVTVLASVVDANCICREGGSSLCTCNPSYVKPKPKPEVIPEKKTICKTYGAKVLHPIGDVCSCGKIHVAPENIGCSGTSDCQCKKCQTSRKDESRYAIFYEDGDKFEGDFAGTEYDFAKDINEQKSEKKLADAISIALAYEEQHRCSHNVPESKLHYGHVGKVKDDFRKEYQQDLKEGALYKLVGEPISLGRCKHRQIEEVEEEEEEENDEFVPYAVGYGEIGYKPHRYQSKTYVRHYTPEKSYECKDKVTHVHSSSCGCETRKSKLIKDSDHSSIAFELLRR